MYLYTLLRINASDGYSLGIGGGESGRKARPMKPEWAMTQTSHFSSSNGERGAQTAKSAQSMPTAAATGARCGTTCLRQSTKSESHSRNIQSQYTREKVCLIRVYLCLSVAGFALDLSEFIGVHRRLNLLLTRAAPICPYMRPELIEAALFPCVSVADWVLSASITASTTRSRSACRPSGGKWRNHARPR